jgi:hypothetical protein
VAKLRKGRHIDGKKRERGVRGRGRGRAHLVIARFVGKVQELESGLETGVTGASPPTVTSMGSSFYLGGQVQGRRP